MSLPPNGALPKLFPTLSCPSTLSPLKRRSLPTELSPGYCSFPSVHPVVSEAFLPSNIALPKLLPTVLHTFTLLSLKRRSLPTKLSLHPAPSQQSDLSPSYFPQPSVHLVVASISLLLNRALPKLFPTVSPPSTLSSRPYRFFPTELSRSYVYFPRFLLRPPCRRFHHAPSEPHRRCFWEKAFTQRSFYTQTGLHRGAITHEAFNTGKLLHTEAFNYTEYGSFYTEKSLHKEVLTRRSLHTHTEAFTQRSLLHTEAFTQSTVVFTQRNLYTKKS